MTVTFKTARSAKSATALLRAIADREDELAGIEHSPIDALGMMDGWVVQTVTDKAWLRFKLTGFVSYRDVAKDLPFASKMDRMQMLEERDLVESIFTAGTRDYCMVTPKGHQHLKGQK